METQIAALAIKMVPGIDKIRFVNSGTEACMSAIRLARGFTKKDMLQFKAGVSNKKEFQNRIIFPSFNSDQKINSCISRPEF